MNQLKIGTLNVASASKERARRIIDEWITPSGFDLYVLTETSEGAGSILITSELKEAGWSVFQRPTLSKDRGVAIVSRVAATESSIYPTTDPGPGRSIVLDLHTTPPIQVVGMYVPNRGNDPAKTARKKAFLSCWLSYLVESSRANRRCILIGDLNIVPPAQQPLFLPQEPFEYAWYRQMAGSCRLYDAAVKHHSGHESTWVANTGEGYTYDHIMIHESLATHVIGFSYNHTTRSRGGVTDHSALALTLSIESLEFRDLKMHAAPKQATLF